MFLLRIGWTCWSSLGFLALSHRNFRTSPGSVASPPVLWLTLENRFIGNHETRALHINATFRNFVQGDLNVNDYCLKMKGFTNSLIDLGVDIPDRVLILNILRGLNKNFDHLHAIFTHTISFPSFQKVHDDLCLKEIQQGTQGLQSAAAAPTAFYTMPMACFYECCVLTLIRKMVKLSASFIPLIM
jgi:hypothetical protein